MPFSLNIPSDLRTPGTFVDIDSSDAGSPTAIKPLRVLAHGIMLSSGTATELIAKRITSEIDGDGYFGEGSQLASMCRRFKKDNPRTELWAMGQLANGAGTAASATITVTGTATENGTICLYAHGTRITVGVSNTDGQNAIATAIEAAFDADTQLQVSASAASNVVTIAYLSKGDVGNYVTLAKNLQEADSDVAGVTVAISAAALTSGATNPAATGAITGLGQVQYDKIITGISDDTNLDLWEAEMLDRWGPMVANEGRMHFGVRGTVGEMETLVAAPARNSHLNCAFGCGKSPTTPWEGAASFLAEICAAESVDPAANTSRRPVRGLIPPLPANQLTREDRDSLLHSGISTFKLDGGGNAVIDRALTTYQQNSASIADTSYLDYGTVSNLANLRYNLRGRIDTKFVGFKKAAAGTKFGPGQRIMTSTILRSEFLAWYRDMEFAGWVDDFDGFARDLLVADNDSDPTRFDAVLPVRLIKPFYITAINIAFSF